MTGNQEPPRRGRTRPLRGWLRAHGLGQCRRVRSSAGRGERAGYRVVVDQTVGRASQVGCVAGYRCAAVEGGVEGGGAAGRRWEGVRDGGFGQVC
jgi:hypothetical protein